ncbi:MAG: hypothetical protein KIS73_18695 [Enhydrobacter sp.]|nr:hypothetical protein [Enhydrobacter sp.]
MLSRAEIARGSQGAVKILLRDPTAPAHFDNTLEGCRRSFQVMLVVAPFYALYLFVNYASLNTAADGWEIAYVEALRYVVDWLLFPVLFHEIAQRRGWLERYPRYISSLNWINLPAVLLLLAGQLVAVIAPLAVTALLQLFLQGLFFYWFMTATRMTLGVAWPLAAVLMVVNWVPSYFLSILVNRLLGVTAGL